MRHTQTCTMAEFVWLHIHLDNLQLRLFIQNIRSHTSHSRTHTYGHSRTHPHSHAHTNTHTHTRRPNK